MAFFAFNNNDNNGRGQSHPFWDFVASMENDYSDMQRPPSYAPRDRADRAEPAPNDGARQPQPQQPAQETQTYRAPSVEDENMADAGAGPAKKDLVDTEKQPENQKEKETPTDDDCRGRRCRRGGPRGMHRHGPPPFGPFGFHPFFGPDFNADFSDWSPPRRRHGRHGPPGPPGPHGHRHGCPPPPPPPGLGQMPTPPQPEAGPHHHHGRRHGRRGPPGPHGPGRDFNIPAFLSHLGQRLGIDLNGAAANLGLDLSRATGNSDTDFVPFHDLFDLHDEYLIHVSLPGAKKDDIGLDFDGENHTLRVGGVVYRPGVDETISSAIVHSGRNREVGVFETKIRLPSRDAEEFEVNVTGINAKLRDGVLVIHVPKVHKQKEELKRSIRIDTPSPSPERPSTHPLDLPIHEKQRAPVSPKGKEKATSPSTEPDMYNTTPVAAHTAFSPGTEPGSPPPKDNESQVPHDGNDDIMHDDPPEQLPAYTQSHPDEDYEQDSYDEEEGEYVKINVD